MVIKEDVDKRICPHCHVALLYPHSDEDLKNKRWVKCILCGFCKQEELNVKPKQNKSRRS